MIITEEDIQEFIAEIVEDFNTHDKSTYLACESTFNWLMSERADTLTQLLNTGDITDEQFDKIDAVYTDLNNKLQQLSHNARDKFNKGGN